MTTKTTGFFSTRRNSKKSSRYFTRLARPARLQPHLCGLIPSLSTLWPPSRPRRPPPSPHPPPPPPPRDNNPHATAHRGSPGRNGASGGGEKSAPHRPACPPRQCVLAYLNTALAPSHHPLAPRPRCLPLSLSPALVHAGRGRCVRVSDSVIPRCAFVLLVLVNGWLNLPEFQCRVRFGS
jgi:hypothetical protein